LADDAHIKTKYFKVMDRIIQVLPTNFFFIVKKEKEKKIILWIKPNGKLTDHLTPTQMGRPRKNPVVEAEDDEQTMALAESQMMTDDADDAEPDQIGLVQEPDDESTRIVADGQVLMPPPPSSGAEKKERKAYSTVHSEKTPQGLANTISSLMKKLDEAKKTRGKFEGAYEKVKEKLSIWANLEGQIPERHTSVVCAIDQVDALIEYKNTWKDYYYKNTKTQEKKMMIHQLADLLRAAADRLVNEGANENELENELLECIELQEHQTLESARKKKKELLERLGKV
jgi:hypothetical protein